MIYADYEYYSNDYGGTMIPENYFTRAIKKAGRYIDRFTFDRITEEKAAEHPSLPDCVCEMAEAIYRMEGSSGNEKEKKSETTDGYSVSYVTEGIDGKLNEEMLRCKLYEIAKVYLMNTGLLCLEC